MNRSLWMIAALAAGMVCGLAGCGSQTSVPTQDDTPADTNNGDSTTGNTDNTDGGMTGMDGMAGTDPDDNTDNNDDGNMTGTVDIEPEFEEDDVLSMLADGVQEDTSSEGNVDTSTTEAPFFGEDPSLFGFVDLAGADDVDLGALLDSDRDSFGVNTVVVPVVHGFLGGRTERGTSMDATGIMRGRWYDSNKVGAGAFRGEWTELSTEGDLRFGRFNSKYIDDNGSFQGFLRGRWVVGVNGAGVFLGRWFDGDDQALGVLRGKWRDNKDATGGQFVGRWAGFDICTESEDVDGDTQDTQSLDIENILAGADAVAPPIQTGDTEETVIPDAQIRGTIPCVTAGQPFGFLRGMHVAGTAGEPGTMSGRWVNGEGSVTGAIRGVFGTVEEVSSIAVVPETPTEDNPEPQTITISPDDFVDDTELTQTSEFVLLRTTVEDGRIVGLFEITASNDGQGNAPTGSNVFGHSGIPFFNSNRRLRMDFTHPASMVQITFGGGTFSQTEIGRLDAYNAQNELLDTYVTQPLTTGESEVMSITRAEGDIAWAVAYIADDEGSFGRLDDLVFTFAEQPQEVNVGVLPPPPGTVFDGLGVFVGQVLDVDGVIIGYIRGHYGSSGRGLQVFRGRYLDADFNPRGFIKGRWRQPANRTQAPFIGYWSGSEI